MPDTPTMPTAEEIEQTTVVHADIAEVVNRLAREGFKAPILLAGIAACCADLITCAATADEVPRWFASQALASKKMIDAAG